MMRTDLTSRIARHLWTLRRERGWSLDELAGRSGVSRASLSRIENTGVSPTAEVLARLCAAFGISLSRLMSIAEGGFQALLRFPDQAEWEDPETGVSRRAVSPTGAGLKAELQEFHLPPDTRIGVAATQGAEHHLVMLDGALTLGLGEDRHDLTGGDCLRYLGAATVTMETGPARGARYLLVVA